VGFYLTLGRDVFKADEAQGFCQKVNEKDYAGVEEKLRSGYKITGCYSEFYSDPIQVAQHNHDEKMVALLRRYGVPEY